MYYRVGPIRCRILSAGVQPIRALLIQCRFMSRVEAARILGVEPSASKKEIKKAYIKQAKRDPKPKYTKVRIALSLLNLFKAYGLKIKSA